MASLFFRVEDGLELFQMFGSDHDSIYREMDAFSLGIIGFDLRDSAFVKEEDFEGIDIEIEDLEIEEDLEEEYD